MLNNTARFIFDDKYNTDPSLKFTFTPNIPKIIKDVEYRGIVENLIVFDREINQYRRVHILIK